MKTPEHGKHCLCSECLQRHIADIDNAIFHLEHTMEQVKALESERDALQKEVRRLRAAIAECPESISFDDGGEEFCLFCGGELSNQEVHHVPDCCVWVETKAALDGTDS